MPNLFHYVAKGKTKTPTRVIEIDAGGNHSIAITNKKVTWGWGLNSNGQIGDNTTTSRLTPVSVVGTVKTFCKISAGTVHTVAIDKNGRAWGWGNNFHGYLGDNTTTSRRTPVSVVGTVKTFCKISAGTVHTVAIDKNGRAWAWGFNSTGELGNNAILPEYTPVSVLGTVKTFCEISVGGYSNGGHTIATDKDGRAWGWGINFFGQLGDNTTTSQRTPVSVLGAVKTFCKISTGQFFTIAIDKDGKAWGWGQNTSGQLGIGDTTQRTTPVSVATTQTFCQISAGQSYTMAIDKNGRAWGWGANSSGQIGNDTTTNQSIPASVLGTVKTFCKVSAGNNHTLAIDKNGRAWGWGDNTSGQLGNGITTFTPYSVVGAVKTFCQIQAGQSYTIAIDKDGRTWGWGLNFYGQLGDNTTASRRTPISVVGAVKTFCQISAGNFHVMAIDKDGRAWGWGLNFNGRLGDNTTTCQRTPVSVVGAVKTFCQISAGNSHTVAIDKNGQAWGWGNNGNGQIGDNTITSRLTPVSVVGTVKTFCQISTGISSSHTMAIDKNGRAWGWGVNFQGQIGDNSTISKRTPVSVLGAVKTFCKVSAGSNHTLAIDKNGRAWGWGNNANGQLGDNSTISKRTPVSVLGAVKTFCQISAGFSYTMAIDKNGRAWGWGLNSNGQLGNNTTASQRTPVSVVGTVRTFCKINAGTAHTTAIDKDGRAWAWGNNTNGELGIGISTYTPILITYL